MAHMSKYSGVLRLEEIIPSPLPGGLKKHLRLHFHKADCGKVETGLASERHGNSQETSWRKSLE